MGLIFGLAALVRDAVLLRIYNYFVFLDSAGYLVGDPIRSRPYPIMAWLVDGAHHPLNLIWLQILIGAVATGVLVYVVARRNPWLAALAGILLVFDWFWSQANRWVLTEGPFMSFTVLSLAVIFHQYEIRERLRPGWLLLAGALFAWTATIRPSNLALLVPVLVGYLLFTRAIRTTVILAAGMALLLALTSTMTWAQYGRFQISGKSGYFLAYPLFTYHIFYADNGPASRRIDATLRSCYPDLDYSQIRIENSNEYVLGKFLTCMASSGSSGDQISDSFTQAYMEGIRAHPRAWLYHVLGWTAINLSSRHPLPEEATVGDCNPQAFAFCGDWQAGMDGRPLLMAPTSAWERSVWVRLAVWQQLYLVPLATLADALSLPHQPDDVETLSRSYAGLVLVVWLGVAALIWFRTRRGVRVLGLACITIVGYVCFSVPAGHVTLLRYLAVLSPIESLLSLIVLFAVVRLVIDLFRSQRVSAALAGFVAAVALLTLLIPPPVLYTMQAEPRPRAVLSGPFQHEIGHAYVGRLNTTTPSDSNEYPERSSVQLYENGKALGPPHSAHSDIRDSGRGRFSHWQGVVIFAASDNSDPNLNGRRYEMQDVVLPSSGQITIEYAVAAIAFVLLAAIAFRRLPALRPTLGAIAGWRRYPTADEVGV